MTWHKRCCGPVFRAKDWGPWGQGFRFCLRQRERSSPHLLWLKEGDWVSSPVGWDQNITEVLRCAGWKTTVVAFVLLHISTFNFHRYTQHEATPTQKSAWKWCCNLSWLLAWKITRGIHSCKPALLNSPIVLIFNKAYFNSTELKTCANVQVIPLFHVTNT